MHDNDKTIFNYLNPLDNDILSNMNDKDLKEILFMLNKYYLEYRKTLGVSNNITFGIEIEMDYFKGSVYDMWPFQLELNKIVGNDKWEAKNDITLSWGREITSDILMDKEKTWIDLKNVCDFVSQYGQITSNCSAHVHVGSQILGDNSKYWYRLFKLWSIYENVIYRFSYGEYLTHRIKTNEYARTTAKFFQQNLVNIEDKLDVKLREMLYSIYSNSGKFDELKKYGLSYWHMLCDNDYNFYEDYNKINKYCTIEDRCGNGTFDEIIWQNYINFFIKMILYCKSDCFDEEILNRRRIDVIDIFDDIWAYSKIYLEQALEFSDMIFDNNLDKIYFLRQYLKSFQIGNKPFSKAKRFTVTNR